MKKLFCAGKRSLAFLLALLLLFSLFALPAAAAGEQKAVIVGTGVRVRTQPGTSYATVKDAFGNVIYLNNGQALTVTGDAVSSADSSGLNWYAVAFSLNGQNYSGFVCTDYVQIQQADSGGGTVVPIDTDLDFEAHISVFPESYKPYLRALHAAHPAWRFEVINTGLDWGTVLQNENYLGRSLTISSNPCDRSTAAGAYDWTTDTYIPLESGKWYQASPALIEYYMDPRNFLNEQDVFQFEKLSFDPSLQTLSGAQSMLKGSFMETPIIKNFNGQDVSYAQTFMDAGLDSGVSVYHLIARCMQEVGKNGAGIGVSGTYPGYEGYYNYFSVGATSGAVPGLAYAKKTDAASYRPWDTPYKSIRGGAKFIGSSYIGEGQDTLYLQKFCVIGKKLYYHQYMGNISAALTEGRTMQKNYKTLGLLDTAFTFRIPTYVNIPASCPAPTGSGSINNLLSSLSVDDYSITPTFDILGEGQQYSLLINDSRPTIYIRATAVSNTATVYGDVGEVRLNFGQNDFKIYCKSASGSVKTYSLTVVMGGDPGASDVESGWKHSYRLSDNALSGIKPGTEVTSFLSSLGLYGNARAYLEKDGKVISAGSVGTGMLLHYYDGKTTKVYLVTVYGELNGDGAIDVVDLLLERKFILNQKTPDAAQKTAGDVNRDSAVDVVDLLLIRKHILGFSTITQ